MLTRTGHCSIASATYLAMILQLIERNLNFCAKMSVTLVISTKICMEKRECVCVHG